MSFCKISGLTFILLLMLLSNNLYASDCNRSEKYLVQTLIDKVNATTRVERVGAIYDSVLAQLSPACRREAEIAVRNIIDGKRILR